MKKTLIIILAVVLTIVLTASAYHMWYFSETRYTDNTSLDRETNREIKELLLSAVKRQNSIFYSVKDGDLFTEECLKDLPTRKDINFTVNKDFMQSARKTGANEYKATIQHAGLFNGVDHDYYNYTIKVINGRYVITEVWLDA